MINACDTAQFKHLEMMNFYSLLFLLHAMLAKAEGLEICEQGYKASNISSKRNHFVAWVKSSLRIEERMFTLSSVNLKAADFKNNKRIL